MAPRSRPNWAGRYAGLRVRLAGDYALVTHGLVDRATEDVDLFTNHLDPDEFTRAVETIIATYEEADQPVTIVRRAELYAHLHVGLDDPVHVELAYDWRLEIPAGFGIGPVLDGDDVVAGKVLALWGRQRPATTSMCMPPLPAASTPKVTCSDSPSADAGFDQCTFAHALLGVDRARDADFSVYGVGSHDITALGQRLRRWGQVLNSGR